MISTDSAARYPANSHVNVLGCLVIGVLGGLADSRHVLGPNARLFVLLGVLGGFTTSAALGLHSADWSQRIATPRVCAVGMVS